MASLLRSSYSPFQWSRLRMAVWVGGVSTTTSQIQLMPRQSDRNYGPLKVALRGDEPNLRVPELCQAVSGLTSREGNLTHMGEVSVRRMDGTSTSFAEFRERAICIDHLCLLSPRPSSTGVATSTVLFACSNAMYSLATASRERRAFSARPRIQCDCSSSSISHFQH